MGLGTEHLAHLAGWLCGYDLIVNTVPAQVLGRLELEDENDVLGCGIEIKAQPPGKTLKTISLLSGGEKVRCMMSKMMLSGANFLVFDQPTNHLDLESIAALNNGMEAFKHNIIFSSHDHQLTQTVANRIIEINADGSITDRMCSYDEYMDLSSLEAAR